MKRLLIIGFAVTLTGATAHAEFTSGSQTIAIFGGTGGSGTQYDYQPGSQEPVTGGGGAFGGQYLYYVKGIPSLAVGADITSSRNGDRDDNDLLFNYHTTQRLKSLVGLAIVRLSYPRGLFRPYIFGGLGGHSSSQTLTASPNSGTWPGGGTEVRTLIDEDKTAVALGGGIGVDLFFTERFFLGAEFRGTWLTGLNTDDNAALKSAGFNVHTENDIGETNILFRAGVKF